VVYVIAEPCVGVKDAACVDACPVDAIHPNKAETAVNTAQLYISEDCICCAACVPVCPVSAIFAEEDLPKDWRHFAQVNRDWYSRRRP